MVLTPRKLELGLSLYIFCLAYWNLIYFIGQRQYYLNCLLESEEYVSHVDMNPGINSILKIFNMNGMPYHTFYYGLLNVNISQS